MIKIATWIMLNGFWAASIYFGLHLGESGAENVFTGLWWIHFIGGMLCLFVGSTYVRDSSAAGIKGLATHPVPVALDFGYDMFLFCAMLYFGLMWHSVGFLIASIGVVSTRNAARKKLGLEV